MIGRAITLLLALTLGCEVTLPPPPVTALPTAGAIGVPDAAGAPSHSPVSDDMTAALVAKPLPLNDSFALTRSVKGKDGQPARQYEPVRTVLPDERVGSREQFWVYDWDQKKNFQVGASIRTMTASAKWWIVDGLTVDQRDLEQAARAFEERIYPSTRKAYGSEWSPGIDADPRVNVLVARIPGQAAGYYSSTDEQPRWVFEYSAEREIVFINMPFGGRLATEGLYGTLAHEMCHMIQFNKRARSVVWFSEGQAELCSRAGASTTSSSGFEGLFLQQPDTQLNDWPELGNISALHYGGSYLFLEFLRQHAGGEELINAFLAKGIDTPDDMDRVLRARGQPGLEELFADFVAANALLREQAEERYLYRNPPLGQPAGPSAQDRLAAGATLRAKVQPYAARYIELPRAAATVKLSGTPTAPVVPTTAHSAKAFWWSDRADLLDSTLTRSVDLRGARGAVTLRFWTWYEIEADFDYAYVEVSTDGGTSWSTLRATSTTADDPNRVNLGQGLTGISGGGKDPAWVLQTVDLAAYAGREVQLRFQYVTDGALNLHGIAIDDLEIPEIGWRDDAEADGDWKANGFVRSTNVVKQRFVAQLIRFGQRATVERHQAPDGTLEITYDASGDRRPPLLAVTAFAVRTTQPATFTLEARR